MTDKDIIKALECCTNPTTVSLCYKCCFKGTGNCTGNLTKATIDLINRLQAENKKMSKELKITRDYIHYHNLEYDLLSYSERNGG